LCSHGDNRGERRETEKRKAAGIALHASCSTLTVEPSLGNTWNRCKQDDVAHAVPRGGCQGLERVLRDSVFAVEGRCVPLALACACFSSLPLLSPSPARDAPRPPGPEQPVAAKDAAQQSKQALASGPLSLCCFQSAPRPSGRCMVLGLGHPSAKYAASSNDSAASGTSARAWRDRHRVVSLAKVQRLVSCLPRQQPVTASFRPASQARQGAVCSNYKHKRRRDAAFSSSSSCAYPCSRPPARLTQRSCCTSGL
jgi:hypothetical protein